MWIYIYKEISVKRFFFDNCQLRVREAERSVKELHTAIAGVRWTERELL